MYHITICDDSVEQLGVLQQMIAETLTDVDYKLRIYKDVKALLADQTAGRNCDVLLLDICMPGQDGISAAQEINHVSPATQIIFISAYSSYALDVYETEHIYFLPKPVRKEKLRAALLRAFERIEQMQSMRLVLPLRGGMTHVFSLAGVQYFERDNHVTHVHANGAAFDTPLKLDEIEALLETNLFARPHNSYLVNLMHVHFTARSSVVMHNGDKLPISNQRRVAFLQALARSL